ncbi:MAG: hypothetical protein JWO85_789 [Candidatus Eremiobacteraeota bacterium]|nr:hypothetical protein [Candidatus Eremiobacteraeota bacterium]
MECDVAPDWECGAVGHHLVVRNRIVFAAAVAAAFCAIILATPALAIENPLVATIKPVGQGGTRGNVTFFQMGSNVNVGVSLESAVAGEASLDLRTGTCKTYAQNSRWPLGSFGGRTQETRLPNTKLESLVGEVLLVHKTQDVGSPVIGCAEIRT